jgi:hypothetical protein
MPLGRLRARKLREWVVLLLLPVLAVRLLVPEGFMPRFGDDHALSMQMCHGDGKSSVILRLLHQEPAGPGDDEQGRHAAPCIFAAAGPVAPPAPPVVTPDTATTPPAEPLPAAAVPALRLSHRPQSARAPPLPV